MEGIKKAIKLLKSCKNPASTPLGLGINNPLYDLAIISLEKQIAKKLIPAGEMYSTYYCPNCSESMIPNDEYKYCPECGQRLEW